MSAWGRGACCNGRSDINTSKNEKATKMHFGANSSCCGHLAGAANRLPHSVMIGECGNLSDFANRRAVREKFAPKCFAQYAQS